MSRLSGNCDKKINATEKTRIYGTKFPFSNSDLFEMPFFERREFYYYILNAALLFAIVSRQQRHEQLNSAPTCHCSSLLFPARENIILSRKNASRIVTMCSSGCGEMHGIKWSPC